VASGGRTRGVVRGEEKVRAAGYHLRRKGDREGWRDSPQALMSPLLLAAKSHLDAENKRTSTGE
jgi:hypothetical protein